MKEVRFLYLGHLSVKSRFHNDSLSMKYVLEVQAVVIVMTHKS